MSTYCERHRRQNKWEVGWSVLCTHCEHNVDLQKKEEQRALVVGSIAVQRILIVGSIAVSENDNGALTYLLTYLPTYLLYQKRDLGESNPQVR